MKCKSIFVVVLLLFVCVGVSFSGLTDSKRLLSDSQIAYFELPADQIKIKVERYVDCPRCNGTGELSIKKQHGPCGGNGCAGCDYNGYIEEKYDCPKCNGTGKIKVRVK